MKIEKIEFHNHYLFGNSNVNFADDSGNIYDNILFCGENGSGKTKVVEYLFSAFSTAPINYEVTVLLEDKDLEKMGQNILESVNKNEQLQIIEGLKRKIIIRKQKMANNNYFEIEYEDKNGIKIGNYFKNTHNNIDPISFYLSNVITKIKKNDKEPNIQQISTITNLGLDKKEVKDQTQIFAGDLNINQLLVDLQAQDANEVFNNKDNVERVKDIIYSKRVERLKNAFNKFFSGSLVLNKVDNFDVEFQNNGGKKFSISGLSSGEKSIVQFGGFFLKDQKASETFFSFLDEPEQALHPRWEEKILSFYKDILTVDGIQTSQLFSITHSEHVVKNALELGALIIIMKRKNDGTFEFQRTTAVNTFPYSPTYAEIKYKAFNLYTPDFHDELFGYLQEKMMLKVNDMDTYFLSKDPLKTKNWIGKKVNGKSGVQLVQKLNTSSLPCYIRNYVHHPELRQNDNLAFSLPELQKSTEFLLSLIP